MKIAPNKTGGRTTGTASNSLTRLTTGVLKPKLPKVTASSTTASSIQADKFKQAKTVHRQAKAALAKNPGNKRLQNLAVTTQERAERLNPKRTDASGMGRRDKTYNTSYGSKSAYALGKNAVTRYGGDTQKDNGYRRIGLSTNSSGTGPTRKDTGVTGTNSADKSTFPARSRGYNRALLDKYGSYDAATRAGFSPYKTKTSNNPGRANSDFKIPTPRPSAKTKAAARREGKALGAAFAAVPKKKKS